MRRPAWVAIAWATSVSLGCSKIVDLDEYALADDPPGAGSASDAGDVEMSSARGTLFYSPECRGCMAEACSAELSACTANDECRTLKACVETCHEPGCWVRCAQPGRHSLTAWPLEAVDTCMFSACVEPCRAISGNLDCSGKWQAPVLYEPNEAFSADVQVAQLLTDTPLSGWNVRACPGRARCSPDAQARDAGDNGVATFELRSDRTAVGFEGSFETEDPVPDADGTQLTYRFSRDDRFNGFWDAPHDLLVDPQRLSFQIFAAEKGRPPPPDIGALIITRNFDCHYFTIVGLVAEVTPLSGPAVDRSDDVLIAYGSPEGTVLEPSYLAVAGPPGRYAITILKRETAETYRELELEIEQNVFDFRSALLPEQIEY